MAVEERGYVEQVGPQRTAAVPMASPADFGAQVGEAISRVGDSLHRSEVSAYRIERKQKADQEAADFNARFAAARDEYDRFLIDARTNAAPGAAGHTAAAEAWWKGRSEKLLEGITESSTLNAAKQQVGDFGGRQVTAEYQYEQGARIGKLVTDVSAAHDIAANRAFRNHDQTAFGQELALVRQGAETLGSVPADVREKVVRDGEQKVSVGYLNGLNEADPKTALALIETGQFDDILTPEQLQQAKRGAQISLRVIDNEQKAAARIEAAVQVDAEQAVGIAIGQGQMVDPRAVQSVIDQRTARGDLSGAQTAKGWMAQAEVHASFGNAAVPEINAALGQLQGKTDEASVLRRSALQTQLGIARRREPAFAPVDYSNPASVQNRVTRAYQDARDRGAVVPSILGRDEVPQYRAMFASGSTGRADVTDMLAAYGGVNARIAATQVAPTDKMFQHVVTLPQDRRLDALNGQAALRTNPALAPIGTVQKAFAAQTTQALSRMPPDYREGVMLTAQAIAAAKAVQAGKTEWDKTIFDASLHEALGGGWRGGEQTGGLGEHNGVPFRLPEGVSQRDFDTKFSAITRPIDAFARGRQVPIAVVRAQYTPVAVAGGGLQFIDGYGRTLFKKDGVTPWVLDIVNEKIDPRTKMSRDAVVRQSLDKIDMDAAYKRGDGVLTRFMRAQRGQ